jgi:hypothetical protein
MVARLYEGGLKLHLRLIHPTISTTLTNTRCVQNTKNQMVSLFFTNRRASLIQIRSRRVVGLSG